MKVRLLAVGAVAATLSLVLTPAQATPYAGQFRYLTTGTVAVVGADGARWQLAIGATQSGSLESRTEQMLYVDLSRCVGSTCVAKGRWARPLADADVNISAQDNPLLISTAPSTASLRTVVAGRRIDIRLNGDPVGGGAFEGLGLSTTPPGVAPAYRRFARATGSFRIDGLRSCFIDPDRGAIGERTVLDTVGDDSRETRTLPPAQLPAGFLTGRHKARC